MSPSPDPTPDEQDPPEPAPETEGGATGTTLPGRPGTDAWVDAESAASFPASDPPSDWAGADDSPAEESGQAMA